MSKEFDYPRDFKGIWLPKEIWLDDDLNATDKIIFAEIDSLDVEDSDGCFASNEYLANFCKCSVTKVSTSISKLIGLGYVKVVKTDGRKRWLKTSLSKFESQTNENEKSEIQEVKDINIPSNKDDKNNDKNSVKYALEDMKRLSSKGDMYASVPEEHKDMPPKKQSRYIPPDYTEEQLRKHIDLIVKDTVWDYHIEWDMKNDESKADSFIDIFCLFCRKYKERFGENHYVMPDKTLKSVVRRYLEPPEEMDGAFSLEEYAELIDLYFKTDFNKIGKFKDENGNKKKVVLSFPHFMSDTIRGNLANRIWK